MLAVLGSLLVWAEGSAAAFRFVKPGGVDAGDCTVAECATFTYAIGQAVAGDTIRVFAGTFDNGGAAVDINKSVRVIGRQFNVDARTRTDGVESILTVPVLLSANDAIFDGFTVSCGACGAAGAGVSSSPSFSHYQISNNIVSGNPIGVSFGSSGFVQSVLRFNDIVDNNAAGAVSGVGIYSNGGLTSAVIDHNRLTGNASAQIEIIGASPGVNVSRNDFPLDDLDDGSAVILLGSKGTAIDHNVITGSPFAAIVIGSGDANITIASNIIIDGGSDAISVSDSGSVEIVSNNITGNLRGITAGAGNPVPVETRANRIFGNTVAIRTTDASGAIHGENNWFGCNAGPSTCGPSSIFPGSAVDLDPWLIMEIHAVPTAITMQQTSNLVVELTHNSNGVPVFGFPDVGVAASATGGTLNTTVPDTCCSGRAPFVFTPVSAGIATVAATLDAQTVATNIAVFGGPRRRAVR